MSGYLLEDLERLGGTLLSEGIFSEDDFFEAVCEQPMVVQALSSTPSGQSQQLIDGVTRQVLQVEQDDD